MNEPTSEPTPSVQEVTTTDMPTLIETTPGEGNEPTTVTTTSGPHVMVESTPAE